MYAGEQYRVDLSYADFEGGILFGAKLARANLYGANLKGVSLRQADLREANLRQANLTDALLEGADLSGADLRNAILNGAVLSPDPEVPNWITRQAGRLGLLLVFGSLLGFSARMHKTNLEGVQFAGAQLSDQQRKVLEVQIIGPKVEDIASD